MENASKALLIAGAILICILLIAIGMYIYQSAQSTINTAAAQMGQKDKEMYNATIQRYIGQSKKGSDVKQMVNEVISSNNQYVNESGKFISILNNGVAGYTGAEAKLNSLCAAANVYQNPASENNQANIDAATREMRKFAQKVSAGKNYNVTDFQEDGIIYAVIVTPLDSTGSPSPSVPASAPVTP